MMRKVVATAVAALRAVVMGEGDPLAVVVADHVANAQPHRLDPPATWSAWAARKAALAAAVRAA